MVEEPEPVTELGLKLALAPVGKPLAVRPTTPLNPPDPVTVAVYEVPLPAVTVCDAGDAETEKSPTTGALTTSVTEAVWVTAPLVPVMVSGKLPVGVELMVFTVKVEFPDARGVGLKLAVAPAGNPLMVRSTDPVNPPLGVTVTV